MKEDNFRILLGKFFLFTGSFLFAETILKWFVSSSEESLPFWILPSFALLLIITSKDLNNLNLKFYEAGVIAIVFLGTAITLIMLMKKAVISAQLFLALILVLCIGIILVQIYLAIKKK